MSKLGEVIVVRVPEDSEVSKVTLHFDRIGKTGKRKVDYVPRLLNLGAMYELLAEPGSENWGRNKALREVWGDA